MVSEHTAPAFFSLGNKIPEYSFIAVLTDHFWVLGEFLYVVI